MQDLILTLHIIVCFLLVILILLQSGKEGMGVIFGGGNSSVFGSTGAGGILAKLTTLMAIIFVITSLSYTYVTSSKPSSDSAILDVKIEDAAPAQVEPAPPVVKENDVAPQEEPSIETPAGEKSDINEAPATDKNAGQKPATSANKNTEEPAPSGN